MPTKAMTKANLVWPNRKARIEALPPKGRCGLHYKRVNGTVVKYKGSRYSKGEPRKRPPTLKQTLEAHNKTIEDLRLDNEQLQKENKLLEQDNEDLRQLKQANECLEDLIDLQSKTLAENPVEILKLEREKKMWLDNDEKIEAVLREKTALENLRVYAEGLLQENKTLTSALAQRTTVVKQLTAQNQQLIEAQEASLQQHKADDGYVSSKVFVRGHRIR